MADKWWQDLNDAELDRLVEAALADNPSLNATWDRLTQARAIARREGGARVPSLSLTSNASRSRNQEGTEQDRFLLGLSTAYELDLWGRVKASVDAARFDASASHAELEAAAITLSAEIADAWFALIEQRGQLALLERQVATNKQMLELVTLRFRQGQTAAADVLRQRQLVEQTRGDTNSVRAEIDTLSHQLAVLLGKPPRSRTFAEDASLAALPPLPRTGLPAELLQRRPDVRQAFYRVQAANARLAAAIADQYPRIDLSATITTAATSSLTGATFATQPAGLFSTWLATVASQVLAPIFDAGTRAAEVDRTEAFLSETLNTYEGTLLAALREVEDALAREAHQRERTDSVETQLQLATQVIERLRGRYLHGAADFLDILNALISQQALERELLAARRALISFRIALARALAGRWELTAPMPRRLARTEE